MTSTTHRSRPRPARRTTMLLALIGISALAAGPGAILTSVSLLAGDHAEHRVSMQRDLGHDDIVFCHDRDAGASRTPMLRDAGDCGDDHRLHVSSGDGLAARDDSQCALGVAGQLALAPAAAGGAAPRGVASVHARSRAHESAARLRRSVVLQV